MSLQDYDRKRDFTRTPEPAPEPAKAAMVNETAIMEAEVQEEMSRGQQRTMVEEDPAAAEDPARQRRAALDRLIDHELLHQESQKQKIEADKAKKVFPMRDPGKLTVPFPSSGLPLQQWSDMWFTGGRGRLTVFLDSANSVWIDTVEQTE